MQAGAFLSMKKHGEQHDDAGTSGLFLIIYITIF